MIAETEAQNRPPVIVSPPVACFLLPDANDRGALLDLRTFTRQQYQLSTQPDATWTTSADGLTASESVDADASIWLGSFDFSQGMIEGSMSVTTTTEDDYIGFVFGYQDADHFYLFDWKQADQNDAAFGLAQRGMTVKVVSASTPVTGRDLWPTAGNGPRVRPIFHNMILWADNTSYTFRLEPFTGGFTITILQGTAVVAEVSLADSTYAAGKFGLYAYSQPNVRFSHVGH